MGEIEAGEALTRLWLLLVGGKEGREGGFDHWPGTVHPVPPGEDADFARVGRERYQGHAG